MKLGKTVGTLGGLAFLIGAGSIVRDNFNSLNNSLDLDSYNSLNSEVRELTQALATSTNYFTGESLDKITAEFVPAILERQNQIKNIVSEITSYQKQSKRFWGSYGFFCSGLALLLGSMINWKKLYSYDENENLKP